jgi:hypothetical protein
VSAFSTLLLVLNVARWIRSYCFDDYFLHRRQSSGGVVIHEIDTENGELVIVRTTFSTDPSPNGWPDAPGCAWLDA